MLLYKVVESCKVGYRKPHPRIYEIVLEKLGVPAEQCVFLDDMGGNLKTAASFGIRTIKVNVDTSDFPPSLDVIIVCQSKLQSLVTTALTLF